MSDTLLERTAVSIAAARELLRREMVAPYPEQLIIELYEEVERLRKIVQGYQSENSKTCRNCKHPDHGEARCSAPIIERRGGPWAFYDEIVDICECEISS
jgi:hypothetical protein